MDLLQPACHVEQRDRRAGDQATDEPTARLVVPAIGDAVRKLSPAALVKNPVLFTTAIVALLLTVLLAIGGEPLPLGFQAQLIVWLWLTVLFGTFAEALAEGR